MQLQRQGPLVILLSTLLLLLPLAAQSSSTKKQSLNLNENWTFRQVGGEASSEKWLPAQVPGVVHTDLLRNKVIPDPFYRDNESKLQWIENADWQYQTTFQVSSELLNHRNLELVFDGLDTTAEVYLNGTHVLSADNMFRAWRVNAKPYLHAGANHMRILFISSIKEGAKLAAKDKWHDEFKTPDKSYLRKAVYEFGWDWGPRFVTSGVWKPVRLEAWDEVRVSDFHIRQEDITKEVAHLSAEVEITATENCSGTLAVSYSREDKPQEFHLPVTLHAGVNQIALPLDIKNPELWYPAGYGAQTMYKFDAQLKIGNEAVDSATVRTGLRSVLLRREQDKWGRSFEIQVNGIPIFAKGADVIPFDSFPTRVATLEYRRVLQSARDANMNMIRHWGGGYYESDEFYEICDELGIMVWQDFMFGNNWQPGTYDFKQNVEKEAEYQLRRLRNHPSIVLWCGNNETEISWNWQQNITKTLTPDNQRRMWQDYLVLFSGVLASAVHQYAPEIPYWPSSPSADYEDTSKEYQSGDAHNWDIWHGMVPIQDYDKYFPRFMTEFGFQSFPEMRSVEAFTEPQDRTGILTPVMLVHQKNTAGNAKIHEYMLRDYPEPKDFPSFLYVSQVLQAEAIKYGAEHLRRIRPRSMGSIYWQLNDCWPVASWASLDYYGRWKALHYYARRFYNDLLVTSHVEDGVVNTYVVSDRTTATSGKLRLKLMNINGKVLKEETRDVQIPALSSTSLIQWPMAELSSVQGYDSATTFIASELMVGDNEVSSNQMYFAKPKEMSLVPVAVETHLEGENKVYHLQLSSKMLARSVFISFGKLDATLSNNYFDLVPGKATQVNIRSNASLEELRSALKVVSLADAFASGLK